MRVEQLPLCGGGTLAVYLREASARMPNALRRPMVIVVPGGGYEHVSPREGDPVALQFAAAGYHTAVLTYSVGSKPGTASLSASSAKRWALCGFMRKNGASCRRRSQSAAFRRADTWLFPVPCCPYPRAER